MEPKDGATLEDKIDRMQQKALMRNHGFDDDDVLQLPLWPAYMRTLPNDYARSALFTVSRGPRRALQEQKLFHYNNDVSISYTGIELRACDDELVWQQVMHYAKEVGDLEKPLEFTLYQLCKDVGWPTNNTYYKRVKASLNRLQATALNFESSRIGKIKSLSLVQSFSMENVGTRKQTCQVYIDKRILLLYIGNHYTQVFWEKYRKLAPTARRLFDYICSHKEPYPLDIVTFQQMCGSRCESSRKWRQIVQKACVELENAELVAEAYVYENKVLCNRR